VLDPSRRSFVSRRRDDDLVVEGSEPLFQLGWGGTRNHALEFVGGTWWVLHLQHTGDLVVNGESVRDAQALKSGDRVVPARGLVFTFVLRDDLEPLADALAETPEVLEGNAAVLVDWVLERLPGTRAEAERVCQHLRLRLANARTL